MDKSKPKYKKPKITALSELNSDLQHAIVRGNNARIEEIRAKIKAVSNTEADLEGGS